jgi:hypothetical protein
MGGGESGQLQERGKIGAAKEWEGVARVREERGLQTTGCEINGPQHKLSCELSAPANEWQNSTYPL